MGPGMSRTLGFVQFRLCGQRVGTENLPYSLLLDIGAFLCLPRSCLRKFNWIIYRYCENMIQQCFN